MKYLNMLYHLGIYAVIGILNFFFYTLKETVLENIMLTYLGSETAELVCIGTCDFLFVILEALMMYFLVIRPAHYLNERFRNFKSIYLIVSSLSFALFILIVWITNYRVYENIALTAYFIIQYLFCITNFNNRSQDYTK